MSKWKQSSLSLVGIAVGVIATASFYIWRKRRRECSNAIALVNGVKINLSNERKVALNAVRLASKIAVKAQNELVKEGIVDKKDNSPVTVADYSVQAIVNLILKNEFPSDPIVAEEDTQQIKTQPGLLGKISSYVSSVYDKKIGGNEIEEAIDNGNCQGGNNIKRFWALDPIDGTKGFLRREQYAIALGLIIDGQVVMGVLGCPNLNINFKRSEKDEESKEKGVMFIGIKGQPAFAIPLSGEKEFPIRVSDIRDTKGAIFCESVESGHSSHSDSAKTASLLNVTNPPYRLDSQTKYGVLARGQADIYLRFPVLKGYEEKIWDHAAGLAVIESAGGTVTDANGLPLDFTQGRTLKNNKGVVATNGVLHDRVILSVKEVLRNSKI